MSRVTLFVKGNVDVHDSLHSCRIGGELAWNGINDVLRITNPGCLARLKHETLTRFDALQRTDGAVPPALAARQLPLGSYPLTSQFSRAIFESKADAIILSVQPDSASTILLRHKKEGYLFYPSEVERWSPADREWLKAEFETTGGVDVAQSMASLAAIVDQIRAQSPAPILIYNVSTFTPGEQLHCYQGFEDAYSVRLREYNLALIKFSAETGVSLIDVDTLVARHGADELKIDTVHLTPRGYQLVAAEVVRVLNDLGVLEQQP